MQQWPETGLTLLTWANVLWLWPLLSYLLKKVRQRLRLRRRARERAADVAQLVKQVNELRDRMDFLGLEQLRHRSALTCLGAPPDSRVRAAGRSAAMDPPELWPAVRKKSLH